MTSKHQKKPKKFFQFLFGRNHQLLHSLDEKSVIAKTKLFINNTKAEDITWKQLKSLRLSYEANKSLWDYFFMDPKTSNQKGRTGLAKLFFEVIRNPDFFDDKSVYQKRHLRKEIANLLKMCLESKRGYKQLYKLIEYESADHMRLKEGRRVWLEERKEWQREREGYEKRIRKLEEEMKEKDRIINKLEDELEDFSDECESEYDGEESEYDECESEYDDQESEYDDEESCEDDEESCEDDEESCEEEMELEMEGEMECEMEDSKCEKKVLVCPLSLYVMTLDWTCKRVERQPFLPFSIRLKCFTVSFINFDNRNFFIKFAENLISAFNQNQVFVFECSDKDIPVPPSLDDSTRIVDPLAEEISRYSIVEHFEKYKNVSKRVLNTKNFSAIEHSTLDVEQYKESIFHIKGITRSCVGSTLSHQHIEIIKKFPENKNFVFKKKSGPLKVFENALKINSALAVLKKRGYSVMEIWKNVKNFYVKKFEIEHFKIFKEIFPSAKKDSKKRVSNGKKKLSKFELFFRDGLENFQKFSSVEKKIFFQHFNSTEVPPSSIHHKYLQKYMYESLILKVLMEVPNLQKRLSYWLFFVEDFDHGRINFLNSLELFKNCFALLTEDRSFLDFIGYILYMINLFAHESCVIGFNVFRAVERLAEIKNGKKFSKLEVFFRNLKSDKKKCELFLSWIPRFKKIFSAFPENSKSDSLKAIKSNFRTFKCEINDIRDVVYSKECVVKGGNDQFNERMEEFLDTKCCACVDEVEEGINEVTLQYAMLRKLYYVEELGAVEDNTFFCGVYKCVRRCEEVMEKVGIKVQSGGSGKKEKNRKKEVNLSF